MMSFICNGRWKLSFFEGAGWWRCGVLHVWWMKMMSLISLANKSEELVDKNEEINKFGQWKSSVLLFWIMKMNIFISLVNENGELY